MILLTLKNSPFRSKFQSYFVLLFDSIFRVASLRIDTLKVSIQKIMITWNGVHFRSFGGRSLCSGHNQFWSPRWLKVGHVFPRFSWKHFPKNHKWVFPKHPYWELGQTCPWQLDSIAPAKYVKVNFSVSCRACEYLVSCCARAKNNKIQ